jgi:hypothetical protein
MQSAASTPQEYFDSLPEDFQLRITNYQLRIINCQLSIISVRGN